jgi:alkylglycerol monooxygenase
VYFSFFLKWVRLVPFAYIHETYSFYSLPADSWSSFIIAFMAIDFGYYWFHRFGHEINLLWASHIAHHSSQEYNLSTALRQGAYQPLFSWMFYVPLALFVPWELYYICDNVNTLYQFWIHTRYIPKLHWIIELIFNTPSHHRVHHARNFR